MVLDSHHLASDLPLVVLLLDKGRHWILAWSRDILGCLDLLCELGELLLSGPKGSYVCLPVLLGER